MEDKITISVEDVAENQEQVLVRKGDSLFKVGLSEYLNDKEEMSFSEYDLRRIENAFNMALEKESGQFITTLDDIQNLAKNPQFDREKVKKIYSLLEYYINKDVFLGKTFEVLSNNINTNYRVIYPNSLPDKKGKKSTAKDKQTLDLAKKTVEDFIDKVGIRQFIANAVLTTYVRGNFISYLNGDARKGFSIDEYPLDMTEITRMKIGGTNLVTLDTRELKTRMDNEYKKYRNLKTKYNFVDFKQAILEVIKEEYPEEVSNAVSVNDSVAILNPERVGVARVNNLKGQYGISPLFKALKSLLLLEQIDVADSKVIIGKTKKIVFQKLSDKLMDGTSPGASGKIFAKKESAYAQGALLTAMTEEVVVYTGQPFVDSLQIIEPKTELTDPNTIKQHKDDIINAVGIGFTTNQGNGVAVTEYIYDDLLKTINKIVKREIEPILNKYIQVVMREFGFDVALSPKIEIQSTEMLDLDSLSKVVELYRNKLNLSMETIFEAIGLDIEDETYKRLNENSIENPQATNGEKGLSSIFYPYATSYTMSGTSSSNTESNEIEGKNKNGSEKSTNKDKALKDKVRNDAKK